MPKRQLHQKLVCLAHDEMKVKGNLVYEKSTGNLVGFTAVGEFQNELRNFENRVRKTTSPDGNKAEHVCHGTRLILEFHLSSRPLSRCQDFLFWCGPALRPLNWLGLKLLQ